MLVVTSPFSPALFFFSGRNMGGDLDPWGPAYRIQSQYLSRSVQILRAMLMTCRKGSSSHSTPGDQESRPLGSRKIITKLSLNYQILRNASTARGWSKFRFKYGRKLDYFSHFWTNCSASEMEYQLLVCYSLNRVIFVSLLCVSAYSGNRLNRSCLPLQGTAEERQAERRFGSHLNFEIYNWRFIHS